MEQQPNINPRRRRRSMAAQNRTAQGRALAILLIAAICLGLLVNLFTPDRTYSPNENRMLAQFPEFSLASLADGSFFSGLEGYTADQFAGRDLWISLQLKWNRLLGQKESNGVYLGKDDYLIQVPEAPDWKQVDATLEAVNAFAARHSGLKLNMLIVPNAVSVLSHKLPDNAPVRDQQKDLDYIRSGLTGVNFLDASTALNKHSDEELYYRTDHHWTSLGAYYAFSAVAKGMGLTSVVQNYDIYTVSNSFEGTLASKSGSHSVTDTIRIYAPKTSVEYLVTYEDTREQSCSVYRRDCLEDKDQYTVFFGGNHPRITIETTANSGKTLLLFKDSYANCFVQFLTPYYDRIIMIDPRYYYDNVEAVILREGVTDVLFLYNADTFLTDVSLKDALAVE